MGTTARRRWGIVAVAAAAALSGCEPWHCDFYSHGACIEFTYDPGALDRVKPRVDRLLDLELPYWGLHELGGWRIQFRTTEQYVCYFSSMNEGCTDYAAHTLSVRVRPEALGCFEAAELQHELGHYALGDPQHVNKLWEGVPARFAPVVWDRPDAPGACVQRWGGIRTGMWIVREGQF